MRQAVSNKVSKQRLKMTHANEDDKLTRRGVVLYKTNPFMQAGLVKPKTKRVTNRKGDLMVVGETGEIISPAAGFWEAQEVDAAKFIKLYVNGVKAFKELTGAGTKVFAMLYHEMQKNISKDRVYMSFQTVEDSTEAMSSATYKRGISELIAKQFLAPTSVQGWYWLNPDFVFNGDRLAFVRTYIKAGGTYADPRQQVLPLEEPKASIP